MGNKLSEVKAQAAERLPKCGGCCGSKRPHALRDAALTTADGMKMTSFRTRTNPLPKPSEGGGTALRAQRLHCIAHHRGAD